MLLFFVGCSEGGGQAANETRISRDDYGSDWPFTVDSGVLNCEGAGAVYFTSEGTKYAVNGTARGASDAPDVDAIWADDPQMTGLKINIGALIQDGLALCE